MRDASICGLGQAAPNSLTLGHETLSRRRGDRPMSTIKFTHRRRRGRGQRRRDHLAGRPAPRRRHPASLLLARARLPARRQLPRLHGRDRGRARAGRLLPAQADAGHEGRRRHARAPKPRARWCSSCWSPTSPSARPRTIPTRSSGTGPTRSASPPAASRADERPAMDISHPAMAVNLDACINCNLCVRACREVQVNDVIGMAFRGHHEKIVFDFDDPMGDSSCVACGECVQACPTGALMPAVLLDDRADPHRLRRPHGRQPVPVLRRRLPAHLSHQGRQDPPCDRQGRPGQPRAALREGPLRLRLRPPSRPPDRAADPQGRRAEVADDEVDPRQSLDAFPRGHLGRGDGARGRGPARDPRAQGRHGRWRASARPRARTRRPISSRSWSAPASTPTTSITARGSATPRRWRRCSRASARAR